MLWSHQNTHSHRSGIWICRWSVHTSFCKAHSRLYD